MHKSVAYRLQILVLILGYGNVGGSMRLCRDTAGTIAGQSVSGHAAMDDTPSRQAGDIGDTGDGSTVLADWRERRQGEHASTT